MIQIAISKAAYDAVRHSFPRGARPPKREGHVFIWLHKHDLAKLRAIRGPGESYSDAIVRLAAQEKNR
jgi:hypothetical protein